MAYRQMRVPLDAYLNFMEKKRRMEERLLNITHKPQPIKLTKMMDIIAQKQIFIDDAELVNFFTQHKRRRGGSYV